MLDKVKIIPRRRLSDERGWFVKPIDGNEDNLPSYTGEVYVTAATPGQTKGGDYSIETNKWFTIIKGCAELHLEDIETGESAMLFLSAEEPQTVYVPHKIANILKNTSDEEFILVAYADHKYDKEDIVPFKFKNI